MVGEGRCGERVKKGSPGKWIMICHLCHWNCENAAGELEESSATVTACAACVVRARLVPHTQTPQVPRRVVVIPSPMQVS